MDPATKKAMADFKGSLAKLVVNVLGKYNKVDCKVGRIMDNNDFKYIARKVSLQQNVQFYLFLAPFKLLECKEYKFQILSYSSNCQDNKYNR